jgi:RNA polymerase primary sigma factor
MEICSFFYSSSQELMLAEDEQYHLADTLEDTSTVSTVDQVSYQLMRNSIEQAMDILDPRERTIIEMRYGLQGGQTQTLDEVSVAFKLTRERIRQIEVKALRKLRYPDRYDNGLREYVHA